MNNQVQWTNALSSLPSLESAVKEVTKRIQKSLVASPDLGIVFVSSAYASDYSRLVPLILEQLPFPTLIGCGGGGVVGMAGEHEAVEIEGEPALSLTAACLPGVKCQAFHLSSEELPDLDSSPEAWIELMGVAAAEKPQFILLVDPLFAGINDLLAGLDFAYPESPKIGGMASSRIFGIPSGLFHYSENKTSQFFHQQGCIGVSLQGNIVMETIVAQGCRPIGPLYQITKGDRNVVLEMAAMDEDSFSSNSQPCPPLELLRELIRDLSDTDRRLAQHSLFVGVIRDEFKIRPGQRDFLIRNLLGVDPQLGAIAIGDRVRPGQRIQFHLRDSQTSAEDLGSLLVDYQNTQQQINRNLGALLFSCLGRGEALYGQANFDSRLFRKHLGIPLGGFFCNGEIGPVAGKTFLHGYTSAFAIFRQEP